MLWIVPGVTKNGKDTLPIIRQHTSILLKMLSLQCRTHILEEKKSCNHWVGLKNNFPNDESPAFHSKIRTNPFIRVPSIQLFRESQMAPPLHSVRRNMLKDYDQYRRVYWKIIGRIGYILAHMFIIEILFTIITKTFFFSNIFIEV